MSLMTLVYFGASVLSLLIVAQHTAVHDSLYVVVPYTPKLPCVDISWCCSVDSWAVPFS